MTPTASFTDYTADGFTMKDHKNLHDMALRLKQRGVYVLISNSDTPATRELYRGPNWEIRELTRSGTVSSATDKRQRVQELLIR